MTGHAFATFIYIFIQRNSYRFDYSLYHIKMAMIRKINPNQVVLRKTFFMYEVASQLHIPSRIANLSPMARIKCRQV